MMWLGIAALAVLGSAPLVAWRWYLGERHFELLHKNAERDEAIATLEPRIKALEDRLSAIDWKRAMGK